MNSLKPETSDIDEFEAIREYMISIISIMNRDIRACDILTSTKCEGTARLSNLDSIDDFEAREIITFIFHLSYSDFYIFPDYEPTSTIVVPRPLPANFVPGDLSKDVPITGNAADKWEKVEEKPFQKLEGFDVEGISLSLVSNTYVDVITLV